MLCSLNLKHNTAYVTLCLTIADGIQLSFPSLPSPFLSLVPRLTTHFSISIGGLLEQRLAIFRRNTKLPPIVAEEGQRAKETSFSAQSHTAAALAARSFSKGPQNRTVIGDRIRYSLLSGDSALTLGLRHGWEMLSGESVCHTRVKT